MTAPIPAAAGWYLKSDGDLSPVIAWLPSLQSEANGPDTRILLPYITNGAGMPPSLVPCKSFESVEWEVVYLPNYDPATDTTYSVTPPKERPAMSLDDAILVTEDGTVTTINLPANPENFAEYTAAVLRCATVEHLELAPGISLWLDEDGHGRWPYNPVVDALRNLYGATGSVHGPVLITGYGERVEPLPQETAHRLLSEINQVVAD